MIDCQEFISGFFVNKMEEFEGQFNKKEMKNGRLIEIHFSLKKRKDIKISLY
jgi:hypothetical protein